MTAVKREHLAGLKYALMIAEGHPELLERLQCVIAQASAAPEQEAVTVAIYSDASKPPEEWMRAKPFALIVGAGGVEPHLQRRIPGVQDVTIAYTHPSAEIERLRAELAECSAAHANLVQELRAIHSAKPWLAEQKLADAKALLREWQQNEDESKDWVDFSARIDALLSATAQPAECQHRYMYFGTQPARRCADCNKVEPAEVKS